MQPCDSSSLLPLMMDAGDPLPASSSSSSSSSSHASTQPPSSHSTACTCASPGITASSPPSAHLASAIVGPTPSPISYLNEYLLAHTLHLAGALPSPSHPPLQHVMILPSLQLLSFMVCRPRTPPPSPHFLYDEEEVALIARDSRGKRVWSLRYCHARKREQREGDGGDGGTAAASAPSPSAPAGSTQQAPPPVATPSDDRFLAAWQACAAAVPSASSSSSPSSSAATAAESSPADSAAAASAASPALLSAPSTKSNLRNAIVSARGLPFSASSSQSARSHWKPASAFSLFDAQRDSNAWLSAQEATAEHQQYTAAVAQQLRSIAASSSPALPPAPATRPAPPPVTPLGDGFPYLHGLLHHLGFFSSLVSSSAAYGESGLVLPPSSELLVGGSGKLPVVSSSASLLLLQPSPALTAQLEQLDMIEDRRLCRVLLLQRRAQQQLDTQMMRNRTDGINAASQSSSPFSVSDAEAAAPPLSFDAFVSLLSAAPSPSQSQLQLLIPSRLCASLVRPLPAEGGEERGLFAHFLSTTPVRLVWCEDETDSAYVPPHRQRRRDRRQWRREQERRERKGRETAGAAARLQQSSPQSSSSSTMPASSSFSSASSAALVYVVVSRQSGDSPFRLRIDCDYRLRSPRRAALAVDAPRSQQTAGSSASRSPMPPLLKANSLSNVTSAHSVNAASSAAAASSSSPAHLLKGLGRGLLLRLGTKGSKAASASSSSGHFLTVGDRERSAAAQGGTRDGSPRSARGLPSGSAQQRSPHRANSRQRQQEEEEARSRQEDEAVRAEVRADWPPPELLISREELPGRARAWLEEAVSRVDEWREERLRRRRRQEEEQRAAQRMQRRKAAGGGGDWLAGEDEDGEQEVAELQSDGPSAALGSAGSGLSARCALRLHLLRDIVREHGEFLSPGALLAACFGSQTSRDEQQT